MVSLSKMSVTLVVVCTCLLALVLAGAQPAMPQPRYTTKYDNINIDQIIRNERLLTAYFNCLMGRGKCTPEGEELKRALPDALQTGCSKCSNRQKQGTEKVTRHLIDKKPNLFNELEKKYDPKGVYRQRYRAEVAKHGIKV